MKPVVWSPDARLAYEDFLVWLNDRNPSAAQRADKGLTDLVEALGRRTMPGRPSKWKGLRITSVLAWHKIIVFQVADDHIRIAGFYDSRQDASAFDFKAE